MRAAVFAASLAAAAATLGVDLSSGITASSAKCVVSSGYTFAVTVSLFTARSLLFA